MYQVDDKPIETIHLYVVREGPARPSLAPIVISLFISTLLILLGISYLSQQPETRTAIRVPAVLSFTRTYSAAIQIVPTGIKTYPATVAHGLLTIRNGSVIGQSIPAGFVVSGVVTDRSVYVPGATADGFGIAMVAAHALTAGVNLPALAINAVIGTSLFIRNPSPFTGASPAYAVKYATEQDTLDAVRQARNVLENRVTGDHYPCEENQLREAAKMVLIWRCQFVTFHISPNLHVVQATFNGKFFTVLVAYPTHAKQGWVK